MGLPAKLTTQNIENFILETTSFNLLMWKISVDDRFAIVKTREICGFLCYIIWVNTNIQFTVESEVNVKLRFLDTDITKEQTAH